MTIIEQLNGENIPGGWPQEILDKWAPVAQEILDRDPKAVVTHANYFTPRPYQDEYCRGSRNEGFTYTIANRHVWQVILGRQQVPQGQGLGSL